MGHGEPDAALVKSLEASFAEALGYYERILQKQDYLTGNVRRPKVTEVKTSADDIALKEVSLVDLFHVPWLEFLPRLDMEGEIQSRDNVRRWWKRLQQRPSWQKILSDFAH